MTDMREMSPPIECPKMKIGLGRPSSAVISGHLDTASTWAMTGET